jgi:tRNA A-37 threonylcarbamoyl transferase component Bud32
MRVCPRCETKTDESGTFCPDCGTSFMREALREAAEQSAVTIPRGAVAVDPVAATGSIEIDPTVSSLVGYTIDHQFVVESELGGGAFGTVFRGRQLGLDRVVAIKVPTHQIAADPVMAKRFAREARSAAKIQHPGVVAIHAVGELADGRPYLVMQFVEGEPLDHIIADGAIPPTRALRIVRAVASALSDTHAAGIVHRDLKPSNIMWQRDRNNDDRLTIVDFGIAASKPGTADASRLTANGLIGTPHYMSPEQAHGEAVDARSDLYALGCLLFELVTGGTPFEGSAFEVLLAHLGKQPPAPSERNASVPEVIDGICASLMQKKSDDRPQTADEVVTLIDVALSELATSTANDSLDRTAKKPARKRRPTQATRPDLPEDYLAEVAGRPAVATTRPRWRFALGAVAGVAIASAGYFTWTHLRTPIALAAGEDAAEEEVVEPMGSEDKFREINDDDGEIVIHVRVPDPIVAKQEIHPRIEIKNKLGQPIKTTELVVTVADGNNGPTGMVAHPRKAGPGYAFKYTFPHAGHYMLRVFPPSVASAFEIPLDVK